MSPTHKPCALLRLMAERQGQKITARDVAALQLAVRTMEELQDQHQLHIRAYGDTLSEIVTANARAAALQDGMRALLEVHS